MRRLMFALAVAVVTASFARAATVDPPQRIKIQKLDRSELAGLITSYSEDGFEMMDVKKQTSTVTWDELPAEAVMNLHNRLVRKGSPQDSAENWLNLGKRLLTMPNGRAFAEQAFGKALRLDPKLKEQIQALRKEANLKPAPSAGPPSAGPRDQNDRVGLRDASTGPPPTTQRSPTDPRDPQKRVIGPQVVGTSDASKWGKQTALEMAAAVSDLKKFAEETRATVSPKLAAYETNFFLFYTDLEPADANKWMLVLDRMYARLAQLFGIAQDQNLWRGKALVFVFANQDDYLKFQIKMHGTVAAGTGGMCHSFGNGDVHIAFYRQPNDLDFAHVLVHESIHGFLHRYRSPLKIPSWANEGLAEAIATDMVPRKGITQSEAANARTDLQSRKTLDDFFEADHIVAWQYPVARTLTEFMIQQNKQGYVDFINAIKDGAAWQDALKEKYGVTAEQLINAYGNSVGVRGLKP
ncbi:MAG: hypothetical protein ABIP55_10505 [Tepidisphaeraceae bacterium]